MATLQEKQNLLNRPVRRGDLLIEIEPRAMDSKFQGTFQDLRGFAFRGVDTNSGKLHLKWSRVERRFNGTWGTDDDRNGKMSLRMVDNEIRGAFTTDKDSKQASGTPRLADLLWTRNRKANDTAITNVRYDVSELIGGATNEQADSELRQICSLIAETIEPESWKEDEFTIVPYAQNSSIVVRQTGTRHAAIRDLLKQLRELKHFDKSALPGVSSNLQSNTTVLNGMVNGGGISPHARADCDRRRCFASGRTAQAETLGLRRTARGRIVSSVDHFQRVLAARR